MNDKLVNYLVYTYPVRFAFQRISWSQDVVLDDRQARERTFVRDRAEREETAACWPKDRCRRRIGRRWIEQEDLNNKLINYLVYTYPVRFSGIMVPLISSLCYGPLGYCQMPRTWWKALLKSYELLDSDYPACSSGLDHWWLDGFGIKDEEMLEYVATEKPNYLDFEEWINETARRKPNPVGRDSWNRLIETRIHRPSKFYSITNDLGLEPAVDLKSAVVLNHLEDWHYFHERDFQNIPSQSSPIIPLIGTMDYGRLGVCQLPRTWLKVILEAKGNLHPDYPACGNGLDAKVLKVLNLDRERTVEFLKLELPSYHEFETWIHAQPESSIDSNDIQEWNNYLRNLEHVDKRREFIFEYMGLPDDGSINSAVVLNTIEDWEYAYRALKAKA